MSLWIKERTNKSDEMIRIWNTRMRKTLLSDLPPQYQAGRERFIQEFVICRGKHAYTWFDQYDIEEGGSEIRYRRYKPRFPI